MNPYKGGSGHSSKRADSPQKEKSWWSGFTRTVKETSQENPKEADVASALIQNFVHIVSMCDELLVNGLSEEEDHVAVSTETQSSDEKTLKKKRKRKKEQLLTHFALMEQILFIFDCLFWDTTLLAQVIICLSERCCQ